MGNIGETHTTILTETYQSMKAENAALKEEIKSMTEFFEAEENAKDSYIAEDIKNLTTEAISLKAMFLEKKNKELKERCAVLEGALLYACKKIYDDRMEQDTLSCSSCFVAENYKMCERNEKGELYSDCIGGIKKMFIHQAELVIKGAKS